MKKFLCVTLVVSLLVTSLFTLGISANTVTPVTYTPNTDYWAVDANGDFTATKNSDGAYVIDTEEKLLGLAEVLNFKEATFAQKATEGETFLITKDMNLNPHITDWSDPTTIDPSTVNHWSLITYFYGTIDGGGHTVKGVYADDNHDMPGSSDNTVNWGMIGNLRAGGIRNIAFDDCYVTTTQGRTRGADRAGGFLVGILDQATTYTFKNIYIGRNATLKGADQTSTHSATGGHGGIIGEAGNTAMTLTLENVVFLGEIYSGVKTDGSHVSTTQEAGLIWKINGSVSSCSLINCVYATYTDTNPHISRHNAKNASYTKCVMVQEYTGTTAAYDEYTAVTNWSAALINENLDLVQTEMGILPVELAKMLCDGIVPDLAYWARNNDGVFTAPNTNGVYEIDSEAKLLGLAAVLNKLYDGDAKKATEGKTFVLTKDMALNAHVTDWSTVTEADIKDFWPMISYFYGTIDGAGHSLTGVYGNLYPIRKDETSNTINWGMIGELKAGGIRNLSIDDSFLTRKHGTKADNRTGGFLVGTTNTASVYTFENIYIGSGVTLKGSPMRKDNTNHTKALGGLIGETPNTVALTVNVNNVVFAGTISYWIAPGNGVGSVIGIQQGENATITATDYVVVGNYSKLAGSGTVSGTRCASSVTTVPAENAGYWIETEKGIMPVKLADMMSTYKWQATQADQAGNYSVRIVAEVASLKYDAVGFKVTLYKTDASGTTTATAENVDNVNVYSAVKAYKDNGIQTLDASTFNAGFMDGADNALFTITLDNLNTAYTWSLEVTAVYTIGTDVIESAVAHTTTVTPWVVNPQ